ncbi:SusD/RagB family nutrient-binding outer membrane lipoprotein [uncultured Muribaculum sp.]|uniref:SusD/RagB family nutrient-binding outer membrane lipoprotein n=1 Tax=uncultured Muribaculum sp. TaxID=1918613 RepID=UPI0025F31C36|nr:SusD/RagB family nutrient-binding outer membrane lipoprotein [uncultured Muribaculum sp.]
MRYIYKIPAILLSLLTLPLAGCFDDDVNRSMYEADADEMQRENHIVGASLKGMQGLVVPTQEHLYQFMDAMVGGSYGGYMEGIVDTWVMKFSTFNPEQGWLRAPFADPIKKLYPQYRDMLAKTDDPVALALGKILRVCAMHRVTDIYGPIPYSRMMGDDNSGEDLSVSYDSQEQVYTAMLAELDEADAVLADNEHLSAEAFRKLEDLYYGNISKWRRFVHSMQLRIAMRMAYVKPDAARTAAEKAVAAGVILSNDDNAMLHVAENRSALMFNDWCDYRISADIVSIMGGYSDPRLEKMFVKGVNTVTDDKGVQSQVSDYYGVRIGIFTQKKDDMINLYSKQVISSTDPYLWMNAAEVAFLRAEGALRGWSMGGDPQALYEQGIKLSFDERGASGADAYARDAVKVPADYVNPMDKGDIKYSHKAVSTITIAWEPGDANFERNLERIITQKWIAIFPLGLEAWAEHRRTGYPRLFPSVENKDPQNSVDTAIGARRLPYPSDEYSDNPRYIVEAVQMLGGPDAAGTRLWWDVKDHSLQ